MRELLLLEYDRARQKCLNLRVRNRGDRVLQRQLANAWRQAFDTASAAAGDHRSALGNGDRGPPIVVIDERQGVARIDQVRILDLRVDLPDLGPIPRVAEELRGDVPQRVAALHD